MSNSDNGNNTDKKKTFSEYDKENVIHLDDDMTREMIDEKAEEKAKYKAKEKAGTKNIRVESEYDKENVIHFDDDMTREMADEAKKKKAQCPPQEKPVTRNTQIEALEVALAKAEEERDSFKNSYQRTFSDFNNYKKRNQTVVSQALKTGAGDMIEKILPVVDNLERALSHVEGEPGDALIQGVSMVYKQLLDIMEGMGVREIQALGEAFDPNLHQAIQQAETDGATQPNVVVDVVQRGYMLDDRILRHSMVIVSK